MDTKNYAYLTLLSSDSYIYYILGLAQSLRDVKSKYPLYCCVTDAVSNHTLKILNTFNINVIHLNVDKHFTEIIKTNNKLGIRQNWNAALDKLKLYTLTQFDKCVYLDSDIWVKQNIDELFNKSCLTGVEDLAPEPHPEHNNYKPGDSLFYSCLYIFKPSKSYYEKLINSIPNLPKNIIWHDQAILAYHNQDWMSKKELHLPCEYLLNYSIYCYKWFLKLGHKVKDIKLKHYGRHKKAPFNEVEIIPDLIYDDYLAYFTFIENIIEKNKLDIKKINLSNIKSDAHRSEIDLVVPYVDSADPAWQKLFVQYNPSKTTLEAVNAKNRFRGQGDFFKNWFRCVAENAPWIRKIHLIVQSPSQVPAWLNTDKVHIVYHKDIIPAKFLPCFSSSLIEMFITKIPGLSDKFLYANDDIFITNKIKPDDFFTEDKVKLNFEKHTNLSNITAKTFLNSYNLGTGLSETTYYICPKHSIACYLRKDMEAFDKKYEKEILASCTRFRAENNLNIYMYAMYMKTMEHTTASKVNFQYMCTTSNFKDLEDIYKKNIQVICLNDTSETENIYQNKDLLKFFNRYYPNACKYELDYDLVGKNKSSQPKVEKIEIKKDIRADGQSNTYLYF